MRLVQQQYQAFFLILLMLGLQACAASNPIARAETIEQKAYATYGSFVIIQEQAAKLASSGQLSRSQLESLSTANRRANDVAGNLMTVTLEFVQIKSQFEAGTTSQDRFIIAMDSLSNWTDRLLPLTNNLIAAVQGAEQ